MKSKSNRPASSIDDFFQKKSAVTFQGEAVAIGEDTSASINMTLDLSDKKILSITKGISEAVAIARSDPGGAVYTEASGQFFGSEADIIIERTETVRSAWSDENGDWSATSSTTTYFAIDFYWIDLHQKQIKIESNLESDGDWYGSGLSGNTAFGAGSVTAVGDETTSNFFLDVLTLEDEISSTSLFGYASIFV